MCLSNIRICVILESYFTPEFPARPAITEIFGQIFPGFGHEVMWICRSKSDYYSVKNERFNDVRIICISEPEKQSFLHKFFNIIYYYTMMFLILRSLGRQQKYNIIFVRNNVIDGLLSLIIKKLTHVPVLFQYSWPIHKFHIRQIKQIGYRLFYPINCHLRKILMQNVDVVLPISRWVGAELSEMYNIRKIVPLPMGVNPSTFSPMRDGSCHKTRFNLQNYTVIVYVGAITPSRKLGILIDMMKILIDKEYKIFLLMVGEGSAVQELQDKATLLGLGDTIKFTGQVPYNQVPEYIAAADICVCPVPPDPVYLVSSPSKLFEYMAVGKPVICNQEIYEQYDVINQSGGGVLVDFSAGSFALAVENLVKNPNQMQKIGLAARAWVIKNRSYAYLAKIVEENCIILLEKNEMSL
jgi:glycosyltransferase involved in cell wall biosynthesis